jgi:hypothetical protein
MLIRILTEISCLHNDQVPAIDAEPASAFIPPPFSTTRQVQRLFLAPQFPIASDVANRSQPPGAPISRC